ncbi:MAG TPA: hypothetical protein VI791_03200 [Patescibacteria group bacterium]|nr:hypothetical protein [Patescibacteria group bacterium]
MGIENAKKPFTNQRELEGDWGEWPYADVLPTNTLPREIERLIILGIEDIMRLTPEEIIKTDPKTVSSIFLLGLPLTVGHLACGASGLLVCRADEYAKTVERLGAFTGNSEALDWICRCLGVLNQRTLKDMANLNESGGEVTGLAKRILDSVNPSYPAMKAGGLSRFWTRLQYYQAATKADLTGGGGFSVGLVAERAKPMRPLPCAAKHLTLRAHILNRHAKDSSVPRWN